MAVLLVFLAILSLFVGAVRVQGFMPVPPDDGPCPVFPVVEKFDLHAVSCCLSIVTHHYHANATTEASLQIKISVTYLLTITTAALQ